MQHFLNNIQKSTKSDQTVFGEVTQRESVYEMNCIIFSRNYSVCSVTVSCDTNCYVNAITAGPFVTVNVSINSSCRNTTQQGNICDILLSKGASSVGVTSDGSARPNAVRPTNYLQM